MNSTTVYGNSKEGNGQPIDGAAKAVADFLLNDTERYGSIVVRVRDDAKSVSKYDYFTFVPDDQLDFGSFRIQLSQKPPSPTNRSIIEETVGSFIRRNDAHTIFVQWVENDTYRISSIELAEHVLAAWRNVYHTVDCRLTPSKQARQAGADLAQGYVDGFSNNRDRGVDLFAPKDETACNDEPIVEDLDSRIADLQAQVTTLQARVEAQSAILSAVIKRLDKINLLDKLITIF